MLCIPTAEKRSCILLCDIDDSCHHQVCADLVAALATPITWRRRCPHQNAACPAHSLHHNAMFSRMSLNILHTYIPANVWGPLCSVSCIPAPKLPRFAASSLCCCLAFDMVWLFLPFTLEVGVHIRVLHLLLPCCIRPLWRTEVPCAVLQAFVSQPTVSADTCALTATRTAPQQQQQH